MKLSTLGKTFTIAAITALALCTASTAKAEVNRGCSNATLQGTFAYTSTGTITSPPSIAGPIAEVGTQTFDGKGGTTGTAWLAETGQLSITGTYTVNPDCTGTFTLQVTFPASTGVGVVPVDVYFVIDNGGNEFQAIETDDGFVITRIGRRLYPGTTI